MQEKLDAILEKLDELSERINDIEGRLNDLECNIPEELSDVVYKVKDALRLTSAMIPDYSKENIIILHTDGFRTAAILDACLTPGKNLCDMMTVTPEYLDPSFLSKEINNLFLATHFVLSSDIFARSAEFEKIIADAINEDKANANFIIITNNIEMVPQSLRDIMRTVK